MRALQEGSGLIDVFISHALADADWSRELAGRLRAHGLKVFFDEWSLKPGDVVIHKIEKGILESRHGIVVVSPAAATSLRALNEYAALSEAAGRRGLRLIPVLIGDVELPPHAAGHTWRDFRALAEDGYAAKVRELADVMLGRVPHDTAAVARENFRIFAAPGAPSPDPEPPSFMVCHTEADRGYARELTDLLRAADLPAWWPGDLRPGDRHFQVIRRRLRHAVAVVVLMSPQSQESDDITRMIVEADLHGRAFFPILLQGERNFHLAHTWYFDARDGRLPGPGELDILRRLHRAVLDGRPADPVRILPPPLDRPPVRALRVAPSASLERLDRYLREEEFHHADLLTTAMLLEAADRLDEGWLMDAHGRRLPLSLLAGIDTVWARHTHGRQGFHAQLGLARVGGDQHMDFLRLAVAYGWRPSLEDDVPQRYQEFAEQGGPGGRPGFFPTLRNPQNDRYQTWYDEWTATALAVHLRLRDWKEAR